MVQVSRRRGLCFSSHNKYYLMSKEQDGEITGEVFKDYMISIPHSSKIRHNFYLDINKLCVFCAKNMASNV